MIWIAAALMAALSAGLVMHRAARGAGAVGASDPALDVYRRQLAEIDDLAGRGLMADDERRAARAETGRRLLAQADSAVQPVQSKVRPIAVMLLAGAPALLAVALYAFIGQPALPDLPFKSRLATWKTHPEQDSPQALGALLQELARQRPTDPEPLAQLARLDVELGDIPGAAHALRRASLIAPNNPAILEMLSQVQIMQAQGKIDAQAEASLQKLLTLDPGNATARYDLARARILRGDTAGGLADWKALLASLAADDPRKAALATDIDAVEKTGKLAPPPAPAGPPAEASGAQAPAAATAQMIQGMVDGLAARLKANPDDPAGWVRLVRAYTVLGQTDKRDAALAEARRRYAGRPDVLSQLNDAMAPQR